MFFCKKESFIETHRNQFISIKTAPRSVSTIFLHITYLILQSYEEVQNKSSALTEPPQPSRMLFDGNLQHRMIWPQFLYHRSCFLSKLHYVALFTQVIPLESICSMDRGVTPVYLSPLPGEMPVITYFTDCPFPHKQLTGFGSKQVFIMISKKDLHVKI